MADFLTGEEVLRVAEAGMAEGLNAVATAIWKQSQVEVPKAVGKKAAEDEARHETQLVDSALYPGNEPAYAASPGKMVAIVAYEHPAAVAQHEGAMDYRNKHGKEVEWVVEHYTTPGTKKKYLEDPFKAEIPSLEPTCARFVEAALEGLGVEGVAAPAITVTSEFGI